MGHLLIAFTSIFLLALPAAAQLRLPSIISDHMVLQAGMPAPVWGWASPGAEVTVSLAGQTHHAVADGDGRWFLRLDPLRAVARTS